MSVELKEKILDRFNSLMRIAECMELRIEQLSLCMEDIKRNMAVSHLLQIIKSIIGTFSSIASSQNPPIIELHQPENNKENNNILNTTNEDALKQTKSQVV